MKRNIYKKLLNWKKNSKKPLIVLGARQVGKTYVINEFCKNEFKDYISINLFEREDIISLYNNTILTSEEKFNALCSALNKNLDDENFILFIDEIQQCGKLISELKYFCEKHPKMNVICAGSLLGIKLKKLETSFPVGKIDMETLYPMNFEEFLMAQNELDLITMIKECFKNFKEMPSYMHERALKYYRLYLITGGMPESVENMIKVENNIANYDYDILSNIVNAYIDDMNKYVDNKTEALKIKKIYDSIPYQLGNTSSKFQYTKLGSHARTRDYEISLEWLLANSMVIKSKQVSTPGIPPEYYAKEDVFKLYLSDVGITTNCLKIKPHDIILDNIETPLGVITENYVAQELLSINYNLYYWKSSNLAEIDFLLYTNDGIIPIEVKAGEHVQSKSLNIYMQKFSPKYGIRISRRNFGYDKTTNLKSLPLYAVFCLEEV